MRNNFQCKMPPALITEHGVGKNKTKVFSFSKKIIILKLGIIKFAHMVLNRIYEFVAKTKKKKYSDSYIKTNLKFVLRKMFL